MQTVFTGYQARRQLKRFRGGKGIEVHLKDGRFCFLHICTNGSKRMCHTSLLHKDHIGYIEYPQRVKVSYHLKGLLSTTHISSQQENPRIIVLTSYIIAH